MLKKWMFMQAKADAHAFIPASGKATGQARGLFGAEGGSTVSTHSAGSGAGGGARSSTAGGEPTGQGAAGGATQVGGGCSSVTVSRGVGCAANTCMSQPAWRNTTRPHHTTPHHTTPHHTTHTHTHTLLLQAEVEATLRACGLYEHAKRVAKVAKSNLHAGIRLAFHLAPVSVSDL